MPPVKPRAALGESGGRAALLRRRRAARGGKFLPRGLSKTAYAAIISVYQAFEERSGALLP